MGVAVRNGVTQPDKNSETRRSADRDLGCPWARTDSIRDKGCGLAIRTKDGVSNVWKKGIYQHGHPGVLKGVDGARKWLAKCGKQLVSCGRGGQLVVQSWGAWGMQWMEGKTVRHTDTEKRWLLHSAVDPSRKWGGSLPGFEGLQAPPESEKAVRKGI